MRLALLLTLLIICQLSAQALTVRDAAPGPIDAAGVTIPLDDLKPAFDEISVETLLTMRQPDASATVSLPSDTDTISITMQSRTEGRFTGFERSTLRLRADRCGKTIVERLIDESDRDFKGRQLSLDISLEGGRLRIAAGENRTLLVDTVCAPIAPDAVRLTSRGRVDAELLSAAVSLSPEVRLDSGLTLTDLQRLTAASTDSAEGLYTYLDRQNDPRYARPGGRYTVALISDGEGGYKIIYIAGAEVNAPRWHEGMVKGRLRPTRFVNHFDLEWVDAGFSVRDRDVHASLDPTTGILTLNFPLLKTQLRLSRTDADSLKSVE